jgi:hypothetical protein
VSEQLPRGRDGKFCSIATDVHTGRPLEVAFVPGGGHATRRTIPEAAVEQIKRQAAASREVYARGFLLGNTQRHRVPHHTMPHALRQHLEQRLGPYRENKERWKAVVAAEYPELLMSGYRS